MVYFKAANHIRKHNELRRLRKSPVRLIVGLQGLSKPLAHPSFLVNIVAPEYILCTARVSDLELRLVGFGFG